MTPQERVIALATSQLGTQEAGKNITKYANDFDTKYPNFYNGKKQGAEWCDIFYDWCFVTEFGEDTGRQMLYQPWKSAGAGCKFSAGYYQNHNAFFKSNPQKGDQIFFYVGGEINHTGMVVDVADGRVLTIEGNSGNKVAGHSYLLTNSKIAGYGRPNWSLVDDKPVEVKTVNIEMVVLTYGMSCNDVKTFQRLANALGYVGANGKKLKEDGIFGNNCKYACGKIQEDMIKKGIIKNVDYICGYYTWNYLLKG